MSTQWWAPTSFRPDPLFSGGGEMGARMRTLDWTQTPLGAPSDWPQSLRTAVSICLNSRHPMVIWWGPELVLLYNDAWIPILGPNKNKIALGRPGHEVWPEIWDVIGPMLRGVLERGEATWSDDQLLEVDRTGYTEEAYFTWSYSPISIDSDGIGGVFTAITETTESVLTERRQRTLRDLGVKSSEAKSAADACRAATDTLRQNRKDIPFAILYLMDWGTRTARLVSTSGVEPGGLSAPLEIPLSPGSGAIWPVAAAACERSIQRVPLVGFTAPLPIGGWQTPCKEALVLPIFSPTQEETAAVLISGVNPRKALDSDHRNFFGNVRERIGNNIAAATAYEQERRRAEALAELDRAKTTFFNNVSHEFRTPLTLMLGPLEDLLHIPESASPEMLQRQLRIVHRNGQRLLKLVNTLLDFSRIEAGRLEASFEPIDLAAFTRDLAVVFQSAMDAGGLQFVVDCESIGESVYVDRDMYEKIFLNLVSNAIKFTFHGTVTVTLRRVDDTMRLTVADTGVGIPPEELSKIFERFHRVHGTKSRTHEGTGIGLALVQELARLHGGKVRVSSEVGKGSAFEVEFPLGVAHLPPEKIRAATFPKLGSEAFVEEAQRLVGEEIAEPALPSAETCAYSYPSGARILLVDDNRDMRDYVKRLLGRFWQVECAADGVEAWALVQKDPPDLVLTDMMLPNLDGYKLLSKLRRDPDTRSIPVIVLSARADEDARIEGLKAGADDYLTKPFSARMLLARVHATLQIAQLREESERSLRESEDRLNLALNVAGMGTWDWDVSTGRTIWSERHFRIFGYEPTEDGAVPLAWWLHSIHPEDWERVQRGLDEAKRSRTVYAPQYRIRRNGTNEIAWVATQGRFIYDDAGNAVRMVGVLWDVTEAKQSREKLDECARLLDLSSDAILMGDGEGRVLYWNEGAEKLYGWTDEEARGRLAPELLSTKGLPSRETLAASGRWEGELVHTTRSGEKVTVMSRWVLLKDVSGRPYRSLEINSNITERKHAEEALKEHAEELARFAYVASHDLKEPARMVACYGQLLERRYRDKLDDKGVAYLDFIVDAAQRMHALINDVLAYSRVTSSSDKYVPVDVNELLHEVLANLKVARDECGGTVRWSNLPMVMAERSQLLQVFQNLISNALKYRKPDVPPEITIEADGGLSPVFTVRDNGIGIDPQYHERIFGLFQRLHARDEYSGTGIGLSICKRIVERHGGQLWLDSKLGHGTSFHFTLRPS